MNQVELLLKGRRDGFLMHDARLRQPPGMRLNQAVNGHVPGNRTTAAGPSLHVAFHTRRGVEYRPQAIATSERIVRREAMHEELTPRLHRFATHGFRPRPHEGLYDLPDRDQDQRQRNQMNGTKPP